MSARRWGVATLVLGVAFIATVTVRAEEAFRDRAIPKQTDGAVGTGLGSVLTQFSFVASAGGLKEVPAVLTPSRATFRARINDTGDGLVFRLDYDLQNDIRAAHIHIGQPGANGAIAVTLCSTGVTLVGAPPLPCPHPSNGSLVGTISEVDIAPTALSQGVGDLESLLAAMLSGVAYVNVHTERYPSGEVRGQIGKLSLFGPGPMPGTSADSEGDGSLGLR